MKTLQLYGGRKLKLNRIVLCLNLSSLIVGVHQAEDVVGISFTFPEIWYFLTPHVSLIVKLHHACLPVLGASTGFWILNMLQNV